MRKARRLLRAPAPGRSISLIPDQGPPEGSREGKGARDELLRARFQQCQGLPRWEAEPVPTSTRTPTGPAPSVL